MKELINVGGGFVRLDAAMADDMSVVNAARVSFAKQKQENEWIAMSEVDKGLVNFLMRERHGTPFEHNAFRFHIKCPVFVAREWFRHRIGSFNEFSARYSEVPNEFHFTGRIIFVSNKPSSKFDEALLSRTTHIDLHLTNVQMMERIKKTMGAVQTRPHHSTET